MKDKNIASLARIMDDIRERELIHHSITEVRAQGRKIVYDQKELLNFGSCSYLGLEHHEALKAGAIAAIDKFGFQLSSSRAFASLSLYDELEGRLQRVFGKPCLVAMNTTLAHQTALPIIVGDKDAVILDLQVHTSVQTAAKLLKADGVHVDVLRHNSMVALERKLQAFKGKFDKVWYLADGVYSMFGDSVPLAEIKRLLEQYPYFHVYIDDAHGFGWKGERGEGWVRSQLKHHDRMVMAVSFNKAYGCAGGCVIFPNEEMADQVRKCGAPFIFCGPIPSPVLGGLNAAAELYLSGALRDRQAKIAELVDFTNAAARDLGVPQYAPTDTPLFFIPMGLSTLTLELAARLRNDGIYTHVGCYPATPMRQSGLRFMLNASHEKEDVQILLERIRHHYPRIVQDAGTTCAEIARHFEMEPFEVRASEPAFAVSAAPTQLNVEVRRSMKELDSKEWDDLFKGAGNFSSNCLRTMEMVFHHPNVPEEHCDFYYVIVRDEARTPVLATMFTHSLMKDDMFSAADISQQIERTREQDPHFLTSRTIGLGAPITKGRHLYLNREHSLWSQALGLLIKEMESALQKHGATQMLIREFLGSEDQELSKRFYELGFTPLALPEVSRLETLGFRDRDEYIQSLSPRYRNDLRREVLRYEDRFEVVTEKPRTIREIQAAYCMYRAVAERSFELNLFPLPYRFFKAMCQDEEHDIIRLYAKGARDKDPLAVMFSHVDEVEYTALIVGLNYDYVQSLNTYKQILFQTVMRANALGCKSLDLAFTATNVKKKVGARPQTARAYVQLLDHFNMSVIDAMTRKAA